MDNDTQTVSAGPGGDAQGTATQTEASPNHPQTGKPADASVHGPVQGPAHTTEPGPVQKPPLRPVNGVVLGVLVGIDTAGAPLVTFTGNPAQDAVAALAMHAVDASAIGRRVALMFRGGDLAQPIMLGLIESLASADAGSLADNARGDGPASLDATGLQGPAGSDARRLKLAVDEELVLQCGRSSITLTRAGKVIIRGTYISSKSTGAHRIRGGSIHLN